MIPPSTEKKHDAALRLPGARRGCIVCRCLWCSLFSRAATPKSCTALVTLFNEPFDDESRVSHFPLGHDANIATRALVNKIIVGTCPFSAKERIIFLIHSPSRTFGGSWFHNQQFYLTLEPSAEFRTGRQWDLAGTDWPLTTIPPTPEYLVCSAGSRVVRVLVGKSNQMIGPLTVFQDGVPVVSSPPRRLPRLARSAKLRPSQSSFLATPAGALSNQRSVSPRLASKVPSQSARTDRSLLASGLCPRLAEERGGTRCSRWTRPLR